MKGARDLTDQEWLSPFQRMTMAGGSLGGSWYTWGGKSVASGCHLVHPQPLPVLPSLFLVFLAVCLARVHTQRECLENLFSHFWSFVCLKENVSFLIFSLFSARIFPRPSKLGGGRKSHWKLSGRKILRIYLACLPSWDWSPCYSITGSSGSPHKYFKGWGIHSLAGWFHC